MSQKLLTALGSFIGILLFIFFSVLMADLFASQANSEKMKPCEYFKDSPMAEIPSRCIKHFSK